MNSQTLEEVARLEKVLFSLSRKHIIHGLLTLFFSAFVVSIGIIILYCSCEQALKSGQLPADFQFSYDNAQSGIIHGTNESKVQNNNENEADGEPTDVEEQGKDESAPMEQV